MPTGSADWTYIRLATLAQYKLLVLSSEFDLLCLPWASEARRNAPRTGLEPVTIRLTGERSTIELPRNVQNYKFLRSWHVEIYDFVRVGIWKYKVILSLFKPEHHYSF